MSTTKVTKLTWTDFWVALAGTMIGHVLMMALLIPFLVKLAVPFGIIAILGAVIAGLYMANLLRLSPLNRGKNYLQTFLYGLLGFYHHTVRILKSFKFE